MTRTQLIFRFSILAIVAMLMAAIWLLLRNLGMPVSFTPSVLSDWFSSQGAMGPVLLMLLMILAVVVGPIPTLPISAASGLVYGPLGGTAVAAAGALVGSLMAFYLARVLGRDAVQQKFESNPVFSARGSQRFLFIAIFLTRLIPLFSFALISYAAGITAIRVWRYALATLLGMLPMTFVFAGLGHTFEMNPALTVVAAGTVLLVMSALPLYLRRRPQSRLSRWLQLDGRI
ncbi:MAG: TVP38/TMEM64 family protein [Marinobacter adhaerens]|uniref:TVP38/TMEM64 family membrane protein n=1 Tax=Marinobacter adhaerens TaxID=1033846 RepID=A0A844I538_9GAMM|nr:TVP38/TMEM64 family protein [Marinobacter adhaerens]